MRLIESAAINGLIPCIGAASCSRFVPGRRNSPFSFHDIVYGIPRLSFVMAATGRSLTSISSHFVQLLSYPGVHPGAYVSRSDSFNRACTYWRVSNRRISPTKGPAFGRLRGSAFACMGSRCLTFCRRSQLPSSSRYFEAVAIGASRCCFALLPWFDC